MAFTYEKYISKAIDIHNDLVKEGYKTNKSISRMFATKSKLYEDLKTLFSVMILFPDDLILNDGSGTFSDYDYSIVNVNRNLFKKMLAYFSDTPLGNLVRKPEEFKKFC